MINVMELMEDPDFAQSYMVYRNSGSWVSGRWEEVEVGLPFMGPIVPANAEDVKMLPEGDRIQGFMVFYTSSTNPFLISRDTSGNAGTADQPEWGGERYKILQVYPYDDYGYQKAIGTRIGGV